MKEIIREKARLAAINIRKTREFKGYTQDYLAAKIGISQNAYSKIELGYSKISIDRLFEISILLGVDATALISTPTAELLRSLSEKVTLEEA